MSWTPPADWSHEEVVTATKLNTHVRDNLRETHHVVAYVEFTADVSTSTHTEAAPLDVVSSGALSYVGDPIIVEFQAAHYVNANGAGAFNIFDGATNVTRLIPATATGKSYAPHLFRKITPSADTHTYKIVLWTAGGATAVLSAGAGGAATPPGFIRIWQKGGA